MIIDPSDLRRVRKELGITEKELAKLSGVSQSLIAKIELGMVDPSYSKMKAISEAIMRISGLQGKASDIMTSPVIKVSPDDTVEKAAELFEKHGISQVPVMVEGVAVGSFTERDLIKLVSEKKDVKSAFSMRIRDVMGDILPVVGSEAPIPLVLSLLEHSQAVLVSRMGEIVGIITRADVLKLRKRQ
jgi:predicted transcriptional regulator